MADISGAERRDDLFLFQFSLLEGPEVERPIQLRILRPMRSA